MISVKNTEQIRIMRESGRITAEALCYAGEILRDGMTTLELDHAIHSFVKRHNVTPAFLGYGGFPGSACISLNNEVIHGIPSAKRIIREGDIVKIDFGVIYRGYYSDSARTFGVGHITADAQRLIDKTRESFFRAMEVALSGNRIGDIGHAVENHVTAAGYSVVRRFVGHGVGAELHEDPEVPNFGTPGRGPRLFPGMTLAIEPMVNAGKPDVRILPDGWTVVTQDGSLSAHYENSIVITENGPMILTEV